jgi:nitroreductase
LVLTNEELLTTTRAVRKRLDTERPVDPELVEACLRIAFQAPTGANSQNWGWVVITDPELRRQAAEIYRSASDTHFALYPKPMLNMSGWDIVSTLPQNFPDVLASVPMLVVPAFAPRYGTETAFAQATLWGSLLPAVWNFMLALRMHGLGSVWTTNHLHHHEDMAELLGIPPECMQAGLFPVAYTIGTDFRRADRSFSEARIFWNQWDANERPS